MKNIDRIAEDVFYSNGVSLFVCTDKVFSEKEAKDIFDKVNTKEDIINVLMFDINEIQYTLSSVKSEDGSAIDFNGSLIKVSKHQYMRLKSFALKAIFTDTNKVKEENAIKILELLQNIS